ncbi:MAG: dihydroneopterin triphosphate diphosphatase [Candidatus Protistobacter heckmanni]|nr:dihydroneopterin triphosphate diphosphatase [Candidatus Protistobacter heckmanni]
MVGRPFKIPVSVLVVIHTPALEVLLIERADRANFWQSVTGSIDALDEPLAQAAAREAAQETGIVLGSSGVPASALRDWGKSVEYDIYPHYRHRYAPGVTRNVEHWFSLEVPQGTEAVLAPREHVDTVWLPWREAATKCYSPSNGEAILELPERLRKI